MGPRVVGNRFTPSYTTKLDEYPTISGADTTLNCQNPSYWDLLMCQAPLLKADRSKFPGLSGFGLGFRISGLGFRPLGFSILGFRISGFRV